ncbi:hypothetical protein [Lactiplantibacillus plajomi]|uniref:Integral membrane protein n=1 Tax=Lactiplantibacillus plajomi TaxID=1457217 RepID=A0ABV6K7U1_9LACO|nr:hypothetical protein [Lactiplantibacillus plajomi]
MAEPGFAWLATIVADMVQPVMIIWVIALIVFSLGLLLQPLTKLWRKKLLVYLGATVLMMAASGGLYSWLYGFPVASDQVAISYRLAVGTDSQTNGTQSPRIEHQVQRQLDRSKDLASAYPKIAQQMHRQIQTNLTELQGQQRPFMNQKMQQFVAEDYGYQFVSQNLSPTLNSRATRQVWRQSRAPLVMIGTGYFQLLLIAALVSVIIGLSLLLKRHYLNNYFFYSGLLMDGFVLGALSLEVQGRYHVIVYLPLIFLVICGAAGLKTWLLHPKANVENY